MKKITILALSTILFLGACANKKETTDTKPINNTINVYTRDTSSGTREAFFKGIGFDAAIKDDSVLTKNISISEGNGDIISKLKNDDSGIGYISLSSLSESGLKGLDFEGVKAEEKTVLDGTYGLQRPFIYITRKDYSSEVNKQIVDAYLAYMNTIEGKSDILNAGGTVEIKDEKSWDEIKANYTVCSNDNKATIIKFGGSTSVSKVAQELSKSFSNKCGNFVAEHNHTGSSDGFKRTNGSEKDSANYIDLGFASRTLETEEVVDANQTGIICLDAVVSVVSKNNKINDINSATLKGIYEGTISTWDSIK